jgi:hypothetical protein
MLTQNEAPVEEGQKQPNQANLHQEVAPASEPKPLKLEASNTPLLSDDPQRKKDAVPATKYNADEMEMYAGSETSAV